MLVIHAIVRQYHDEVRVSYITTSIISIALIPARPHVCCIHAPKEANDHCCLCYVLAMSSALSL